MKIICGEDWQKINDARIQICEVVSKYCIGLRVEEAKELCKAYGLFTHVHVFFKEGYGLVDAGYTQGLIKLFVIEGEDIVIDTNYATKKEV